MNPEYPCVWRLLSEAMRVFDRELRLPAQDKSVEVRVSAELPHTRSRQSLQARHDLLGASIARGCARECRHRRQSRRLYGTERSKMASEGFDHDLWVLLLAHRRCESAGRGRAGPDAGGVIVVDHALILPNLRSLVVRTWERRIGALRCPACL
jgi:hypothetical protein